MPGPVAEAATAPRDPQTKTRARLRARPRRGLLHGVDCCYGFGGVTTAGTGCVAVPSAFRLAARPLATRSRTPRARAMSTTYGSRSAFSGDFASRLTTSYTISAARPALFRAAVVLKRSGAAG